MHSDSFHSNMSLFYGMNRCVMKQSPVLKMTKKFNLLITKGPNSNTTLKRAKSYVNEAHVQPLGPPLPKTSPATSLKKRKKSNSSGSLLVGNSAAGLVDAISNDETRLKARKTNNDGSGPDEENIYNEDEYGRQQQRGHFESESNMSAADDYAEDNNDLDDQYSDFHDDDDDADDFDDDHDLASSSSSSAAKLHAMRKFLLNKKRFFLKLNRLRFGHLRHLIDYGTVATREAADAHLSAARAKLAGVKLLQELKRQQLGRLKSRLGSRQLVRRSRQFKSMLRYERLSAAPAVLAKVMAWRCPRGAHSRRSCPLCQRRFAARLEHQIRLKHKKHDFLCENVPLALDLIDKCQLNVCTSVACASGAVCVRCSMLSGGGGGACNCSRVAVAQQQQTAALSGHGAASAKTSPLVLGQKKSALLGGAENGGIKQQTCLSHRTGVTTAKFEAFHRRKCYFDHAKLEDNSATGQAWVIGKFLEFMQRPAEIRTRGWRFILFDISILKKSLI